MGTIAELTSKIKAANNLGIENLAKKGVTVPEESTTYEIMGAIDSISTESDDGAYDRGYADGELAGRENQQNDFWDTFQNNGNRNDYQFGFGGWGWTDETFKPKYNIQPVYAMRIFAHSKITDLKNILDNSGVTLDFSKMTSGFEILLNSTITHMGVIDFTSMNNVNQVFYQAKSLISIEKLMLKSDGSQGFASSTTFGGCSALTHMIVEGTIGQNNFNIQWSDLDIESLVSILNALADKSADTSGTEWKVKIGATNKAKLTEEQLLVAKNKGWAVE